MKVLITGGAGFIGSHLAETLYRLNADVTILDNFSLGKERNLSWIKANDKVRVIRGDIRDTSLLNKILIGCHRVFHQGALPSVPRSIKQPWDSNDNNINGTLNVLIAARDAGVQRFLFASSSSIYGDVVEDSKHEMMPANVLSPYSLQKHTCEKYVELFYRLYGLETLSLRYFNVFGPRQACNSPYSGVIAKFCTHAIKKINPIVYGDGLQARDFTFIDNVVAANLAAAEAPANHVAGRRFNVACGQAVTLLDLITELNKITGQKLIPDFQKIRDGDVRRSLAALNEAKAAFGYVPLVNWQEGLKRTYEWYFDNAAEVH